MNTKKRWSVNEEQGSAASALALLLLLVLVVGVIILSQNRSVDMADLRETGEDAAVDLEEAAEKLRDESMDALTTTKVKTALALSKSVSAFDIDVDSESGIVSLSGNVPSEEVRATAVGIARDISGVERIEDRLEVVAGISPAFDGEEISDRLAELDLKSRVYEALLAEARTDLSRVRVTVEADRVTLQGSVPRPEDVDRVERLAEAVSGVSSVENRLEVSKAEAEAVTRVKEPLR